MILALARRCKSKTKAVRALLPQDIMVLDHRAVPIFEFDTVRQTFLRKPGWGSKFATDPCTHITTTQVVQKRSHSLLQIAKTQGLALVYPAPDMLELAPAAPLVCLC